MTTKHQPATPSLIVNVDQQGRFYLDNGTTPTKEQAERIAKAARAYPKLVEALRKAVSMAAAGAPRCAGNPSRMNPADEEAIGKFTALLRDLGEE